VANPEHLETLKIGVQTWNKWLREKKLGSPGGRVFHTDLSGADLEGIDLTDGDLTFANLDGANLRGARLDCTDLSGTSLQDVNFDDASFMGATVREADLSGATFRGAEVLCVDFSLSGLENTNFEGATLVKVNLSTTDLAGMKLANAEIHQVVFAETDLSDVVGLERVRHSGPSTIGIDTLYESRGRIPEAFLRGAGVPESLITYVPSLVNRPVEFYTCFVSYSHDDQRFARRLYAALHKRGIRCWLDEKQMLPGDDIHDQVDRGIKLWDRVLLCCSERALKSWWVDNEITKAFEKEQRLMRDRGRKVLVLIPLNLDGFLLGGGWTSGKCSEVLSRVAADFSGWEKNRGKFKRQLERVIATLRSDEDSHERPPQPRL
jgi:uncharacterized protein YjbI with pentapeptide repeats